MDVKTPSNFPIRSLAAQRLLVALQQQHPEHLVAATRALWVAYWHLDRDIAQVY
jgi:hypothetical protein